MKCLTIRQPWATLIVRGEKPVEYRTWSTCYRGLLLIHAGKSRADLDGEGGLALGAIVGAAELVDCLPHRRHGFAWILTDPAELPEPVPCAGRLGLWTPPPAVIRTLRRQLGL